MKHAPSQHALGAILAACIALGCGQNQASVLELMPEGGTARPDTPPGSNLRVDVFVVRALDACAIGARCRQDGDRDECFTLFEDPREEFRRESLEFVAPGDPRIGSVEASSCFRLSFDDAAANRVRELFTELRDDVFQLSEGEILLEMRMHEIGSMSGGLAPSDERSGFFLAPPGIAPVGLPLVGRDTDYVFAITGPSDSGGRDGPAIEDCARTRREPQERFGGSAYTWMSASCADSNSLLQHWLYQTQFDLAAVNGFDDLYDGQYPSRCDDDGADPALWFPGPDDCTSDPDSPTCGSDRCREQDFAAHVLSAHWPRGRVFVGNHCRNGTLDFDFDETEIDRGGVCDLIGR